MRTTLLFILSALLCTNVHSQKLSFRLDGRIHGISDGKAVLNIFTFSENEVPLRDTVAVAGGEFTFTGTIPSPMLADLTLLPSGIRMAVFLEQGGIHVEGDTNVRGRGELLPIRVTGSKSHLEYETVASFDRREVDSLYDLSLRENDPQRKSALRARIEALNDTITLKTINFIEHHLNSPVSAYFMVFNTSDYNMSFGRLKKIVTGFGPVPKSTPYFTKIKEEFDVLAKIQPGTFPPDFSLKTQEGVSLSLSDLKGKYVLLDFWASWCVPCRQSFPGMKETYERFHDKGFEIFGVSDDSKREAWVKAITDDKLPWLHVIDEFPVKYRPARVCTLYGIHYLPTTILIDREGRIVAKNLHERELDETLTNLLGKK